MGNFERAGNRSYPETECEKGFRTSIISIASDTSIGH